MNDHSFIFPGLKYIQENKCLNPFDTTVNVNLFFFDGQYSTLVEDRKDLELFHQESKIYVVFEMQRLELIYQAETIQYFSYTNSISSASRYAILSNLENIYYINNGSTIISHTSYFVYKPNINFGLNGAVWENIDECKNYALKYSLESNKALLIVKCLLIDDRH